MQSIYFAVTNTLANRFNLTVIILLTITEMPFGHIFSFCLAFAKR